MKEEVCVCVLLLGLKGVDDELVKIDRRIFSVIVIIYSQGTAGKTSRVYTKQELILIFLFYCPPTLCSPSPFDPSPTLILPIFLSSLSLSPPLPSSNSLLAALPGEGRASAKRTPLPPLL